MAELPIYTHPGDQKLTAAVLSVTAGAADPDYPVANLVNGNPARPAKFTTGYATVLVDFGAAVSLQIWGLFHTNLDAGLSVRVQAHTANTWGAPSLDLPVAIAAVSKDGFVPGAYLNFAAPQGYRYWRLVVASSGTPNSANVVLGQVLAYAVTRRVQTLQPKPDLTRQRDVIRHVTDYDVELAYDRGVRTRLRKGTVATSDLAALQAWFDDARGAARPVLFVADPTSDVEALLVRWDLPALVATRTAYAFWSVPYAFKEVSRGLPWL